MKTYTRHGDMAILMCTPAFFSVENGIRITLLVFHRFLLYHTAFKEMTYENTAFLLKNMRRVLDENAKYFS